VGHEGRRHLDARGRASHATSEGQGDHDADGQAVVLKARGGIPDTAGVERTSEFELSLGDIITSAENGCQGCSLLYDGMAQIASSMDKLEILKNPHYPVRVSFRDGLSVTSWSGHSSVDISFFTDRSMATALDHSPGYIHLNILTKHF